MLARGVIQDEVDEHANVVLVCRSDDCVIQNPAEPRILDAVPGPERGLRSGVTAPVFIDGQVVGVFALFCRRARAYAPADLALVQRLAAHKH